MELLGAAIRNVHALLISKALADIDHRDETFDATPKAWKIPSKTNHRKNVSNQKREAALGKVFAALQDSIDNIAHSVAPKSRRWHHTIYTDKNDGRQQRDRTCFAGAWHRRSLKTPQHRGRESRSRDWSTLQT